MEPATGTVVFHCVSGGGGSKCVLSCVTAHPATAPALTLQKRCVSLTTCTQPAAEQREGGEAASRVGVDELLGVLLSDGAK